MSGGVRQGKQPGRGISHVGSAAKHGETPAVSRPGLDARGAAGPYFLLLMKKKILTKKKELRSRVKDGLIRLNP